MTISFNARIILVLALLASAMPVGIARAASPAATAASGQSQAGSATSSAPPPGLVVVQEDVLIPLLAQPDANFKRAKKDFARGDTKGAAAEVRAGAALLKLEAGRHHARNKRGLDQAARRLDRLAIQLEAGKVKSTQPLNADFADADLALARHYHDMAEQSLGHKDKHTGDWIEASANSLEDATRWSGRKLASGAKTSVDGARSLASRIASGADWTVNEARANVTALGRQIDSMVAGGSGSKTNSAN